MIDVAGWAGTIFVLGTYLLVAFGKPVILFHYANAIGAIGTGASAAAHHAWPSFGLTVAFGVIGLGGIVTERRRRALVP